MKQNAEENISCLFRQVTKRSVCLDQINQCQLRVSLALDSLYEIYSDYHGIQYDCIDTLSS